MAHVKILGSVVASLQPVGWIAAAWGFAATTVRRQQGEAGASEGRGLTSLEYGLGPRGLFGRVR
jgi:hypothetical protein